MVSVHPISFTSNPAVTSELHNTNKQTQEQVAAGVGGVAGVSQAAKLAGKRGIKAQAAEQALAEMTNKVQTTVNGINKNKKAVEGLFGKFNHNVKMYTASIMEHLNKFKGVKFIGAIVKSPITRKISSLVGGALAFFVLVTGLNKAVHSGEVAVDDFKSKIAEMKK